jgi:nucleoside 2-deoxyribosyltransferase
LKVLVCGSIGYGGVDEIRRIYGVLRRAGFETLDHLDAKNMDYSSIEDFRQRRKLSERIVRNDLRYVGKADAVVVVANAASYGTGVEMYVAKKRGKKVVLLARGPIPTPWPIHFSDYVATTERQMITYLRRLSVRMP